MKPVSRNSQSGGQLFGYKARAERAIAAPVNKGYGSATRRLEIVCPPILASMLTLTVATPGLNRRANRAGSQSLCGAGLAESLRTRRPGACPGGR